MIRYLLFSSVLIGSFTATQAQIKSPVLKWQTRYDFVADSAAFYLSDSTIYTHSGNRNVVGNKLEPLNMQYRYDTAIHFVPMPDPTQSFTVIKPYYREAQSFNNNDSLSLSYLYLYDKNSIPQETQRRSYSYNSDKTLSSVLIEQYDNSTQTYKPNGKTQYKYTPAKKASEINNSYYNPVPGTWQNNTSDSFAYDGQNRLAWHKNKVYDQQAGVYDLYYTLVYVYDGAGLLASDSFYSSNGSISVNAYDYNASGLLKKVSQNYYDPNISSLWIHLGIIEYTYDAGGNMATTIHSAWNTANLMYIPALKYSYKYNNTAQLTRWEETPWVNGNWEDQTYQEWHYEIPSAVKDNFDIMHALALYPIPATTYINLEMSVDKQQELSIIIFDMQGRMVKQFTDNANGRYKKKIIIQDMPGGQYMLQVKTAKEMMSRNFTVIR